MKNHLIKIFILLFIASQGLVAEEKPIIADDDAASIEEKKETYIEELVEDFEESTTYYIDVSLEETFARHQSKPNKDDFGETEMTKWYREDDYLNCKNEKSIPDQSFIDS